MSESLNVQQLLRDPRKMLHVTLNKIQINILVNSVNFLSKTLQAEKSKSCNNLKQNFTQKCEILPHSTQLDFNGKSGKFSFFQKASLELHSITGLEHAPKKTGTNPNPLKIKMLNSSIGQILSHSS